MPCLTPKTWIYTDNQHKAVVSLVAFGGKFNLEIEPRNPYNNLVLDHIGGFKFFLFFVTILSDRSLFHEGTTASFHIRQFSHSHSLATAQKIVSDNSG